MIGDVMHYPDDWENSSPDYHAIVSIQLCELANDGWFDLTREDWDFGPKYSAEEHSKLCTMILDHFYYREISLIPPGRWKREFLRFMNEIMPKYMYWFRALNSGMQLGSNSEYYKSRNIYSDFPQTNLAGENQDYASTGNDVEYERVRYDDITELQNKLKSYDDVYRAILNEMEPLFSCLLSVSVNGY